MEHGRGISLASHDERIEEEMRSLIISVTADRLAIGSKDHRLYLYLKFFLKRTFGPIQTNKYEATKNTYSARPSAAQIDILLQLTPRAIHLNEKVVFFT